MPKAIPQSAETITLARAKWLAKDRYSYDALAYDKTPASPVTPASHSAIKQDRETYGTEGRLPLRGNRESLIGKAKEPVTGNPPVGSNIPIDSRHLQFMFTHGVKGEPHPQLNRSDWIEANSGPDHLLLPTAANILCPRCKQTVSCRCDEAPHNPATCRCTYHAALRAANSVATATATVAPIPRYGRGYSPLLGRYVKGNI